MVREQTFEKLYKLKLHGMAQALQEQLKQPDMASLSFEERAAMIVDAQWIWRQNRAMTTRLAQAKLKHAASMEEINYRHPRQLDRAHYHYRRRRTWQNLALLRLPPESMP